MAKIIWHHRRHRERAGGYVLSHGKIAALIQPEVLIIGGAAFGAFLAGQPRLHDDARDQEVAGHVQLAPQ